MSMAKFIYQGLEDGSYDLICLSCFFRVGANVAPSDFAIVEATHACADVRTQRAHAPSVEEWRERRDKKRSAIETSHEKVTTVRRSIAFELTSISQSFVSRLKSLR
jgi:hypothetical protein